MKKKKHSAQLQQTARHILLVVAGISPAIITEAFYKLRVEENIPVSEVWIVTTAIGKKLIMERLLEGQKVFDQLCREYRIPRSAVRFDASTIAVAEDAADNALDDVRQDHENAIFPNILIEVLQQLTADANSVIHACLSGGRKSMSFYLGAAMMMLARERDELIHVIISRELELCKPTFYYPTRTEIIGRAEINGYLHTENYRQAQIIISRIPFLRLRSKFPIFGQQISYPEVVRQLQSHVDQIPDQPDYDYPGRYPNSEVMVQVLKRVPQLPADEIILITGSTGVGKEVLAKYIHNHFSGKDRPYKAVNLGMTRPERIAAELFGYIKGAFTGAYADTPGMFDAAAGGTLFLDEIDKLPIDLQAVLLRVLQEKTYQPVGSTAEKKIRCHILVGTNRNLWEMIQAGTFLADLYYRIEAFELHIPSLSERVEDIVGLSAHFVRQYNQKYQKQFAEIEPALLDYLQRRSWPGNVRELENFIKQQVAFQDGAILKLPQALRDPLTAESSNDARYDKEVRRVIEKALRETDGNIAAAARILGKNYTTLYSQIKRLNIQPAQFRKPGPSV